MRDYDQFVARWPDLERWFTAPLLPRLGCGTDIPETSTDAGLYVAYLSLVHGLPLEADYVLGSRWQGLLARGTGSALGLDLALVDDYADRIGQLGYDRRTRTALTWALPRLALIRADPDFTTISYAELFTFGQAIRRFSTLPEAAQLAAEFERGALGKLHVLHVLLFNIGQVSEEPRRGLRAQRHWSERLTPPRTPPRIKALVERWLTVRLEAEIDRPESIRLARDAVRRLLLWLASSHLEITSLDQLTREHIEEFLRYLPSCLSERSKRSLTIGTRRVTISHISAFLRDASLHGWPDAPLRPLLSRGDLPKMPQRLPRFVPRDELDRLMTAIETVDDPYRRTALLLVRWTGARRGEIRRLSLDCLDAYPDGYPRLRIPVGKGYSERMVPLHPQAADELRHLIHRVRGERPATRHDSSVGQQVRFVFIRGGQHPGNQYLFETPLQHACEQAGLVDPAGRATVTSHRFRHTVGTQLAEGGARIQTIMAILGHRSAEMSAVYSRISDPVVKEQYEKVIAAGGRIAGPAADALLTNSLDEDTVDWLKTNFFKTELELGHCLRLPQQGPCECDLYLRCSKFFTTSEYAPRLRARLAREQQLIHDATERGWPREAERHKAVIAHIHELLTQLGEDTQPNITETCH
jgi:integrase